MHKVEQPVTADLNQLRKQVAELEATNAQQVRQLAEAAQRVARLNEQVIDAFAVHTFDAVIVDVNQRLCDMLGYTRESLIGKSIADIDQLWPKERLVFERDRLLELLPTTVQGRAVRSDGSTFPIEVRLDHFDVGGKALFIGLVRDISARKQVEDDLERFFNLSLEMLCIAGADGYFKRVNPAFTRMLGFSREELLAEPFVSFVHPEDRESTIQETRKLEQGHPSVRFVNRYRTREGDWRWIAWNAMPVVEDGLIYAAARDITTEIKAEAALSASEEQFHTIFNAAGDAIFLHDGESLALLDVNDKACEMLGYPREELCLLDVGKLSENKPPYTMKEAARWLRAAEQQNRPQLFEWRSRHRDGRLIWTEVHIQHHRSAAGASQFIVVARDISRRKEAEAELQARERMLRRLLDLQERERKLTAYEIHDGFLQNVIGGKMMLEGVHDRLPADAGEHRELIGDVLQRLGMAIDEGRRMISHLRPMIIDERGIVEAIEFLVEEEDAKGGLQIDFVANVHLKRLAPLLEDNLFRIVREALTNVQRHAGTNQVMVRLDQVGTRLRLLVEDQGSGFDVDKVPEDHFGLEGIRERARLFGGTSSIRSEPGEGTQIRVELPVMPPGAAETPADVLD